ncbi:olfactory receptor 11A1-like [Xenentodon cancila]
MDDELNITYITLDGHVQLEKYRFLYFVIFLTIYIVIICSNCTIVYLIWTQRSLHEPMYVFIAALLINSVLLSTVIYPKLLIDFLSEKQVIRYSACLVQFTLSYSLAGSEFLLLAAMAYDRYVSICKPLQYPSIMTKTTVGILLSLAWILPAFQTAVPAALSAQQKLCNFILKGFFCGNTIYNLQCVVSRGQFMLNLVMFLNVAFFPVLFILFTYARILIICFKSSKEVRRKAAETCSPHIIVLINFSCLCGFDFITVHLELDFPKTVRFIMSLQLIVYHHLFNAIIYGLKMKEIFKHLKRLFSPARQDDVLNVF